MLKSPAKISQNSWCVVTRRNSHFLHWLRFSVYKHKSHGVVCLFILWSWEWVSFLSHHPPPASAWKQQHHQELWTGPGTSAATCVCCCLCSRSILTRTEIIQGKHIKKTFACFQLKSAVCCASRMVRSELVSFQPREGLWTNMSYL